MQTCRQTAKSVCPANEERHRRETLPRMPGMWDKENLDALASMRFIITTSISLMKISSVEYYIIFR